MKRIALTALIVLMTLSGFSQMMNKSKKVVAVKKAAAEQPQSAVVDFSTGQAKPNVVYGQIQENGDTLLMVMLPDLDID